ncbi:MAG: universal stress protein [Bacteroidales bacterium]|nr:universal stress protein [Bacteroidales bacterium]
MKKVLIALDYDTTAQKVAEAGFSLAKSMKAQVILLHIIADPAYYSSLEYSPITGFAGYMDMSNNQLDSLDGLIKASLQYLDKTKHHLGDKEIQTLVKEGDFASTILTTAKELHADMIVMGSHSRNWLENIVMGSVTEKVLHSTKIPLLIIPVTNQ